MELKMIDLVVRPDGRVDAKGASAYLGLSEKTLAMMRCKGTGPRFVKRGRIFYYIKELETWIKEGEAISTSQTRCR